MDSKSFQIFFFLFSLSAWDHSSSRSLLSTSHPQPVISGGVTRLDGSLSSHRLPPPPFSEPPLTPLLWLLVRTNLRSSVDNRLLKPSSQTSRPIRLRVHGYGKLFAEVQAETLKPRSDLLTQSLVSSFLLMTSPSPLLSVSFALSLSCQLPPSTLPLSPHSLLSLSAVTSRFYPDSSICLIPSTLIQGIVYPSTMTHTCEQNSSKITKEKTTWEIC